MPTSPVTSQSIPVSSRVSRTAACTIDSPRSIAPPGTAQLSLSDRRISNTSPAALAHHHVDRRHQAVRLRRGRVVVVVDPAGHAA